ncbi:MAG TPA: DinB family protein [Acidimicrobiales bacterium]|jgi:hypothetical protein|nr:DinB family protein [Acidimicrobiales bacterium]
MPDRRTPLNLTSEKETLEEFLDYLRDSVILKLEGLDEASARHSPVPSGTSLLWLVKHLTGVELAWFQYAFAGVPPSGTDPSQLLEQDNIASVLADYRDAIETSREILKDCNDLESLCARGLVTKAPLSLRWVLVHMVEETARHAGHADILREQIDGLTGR